MKQWIIDRYNKGQERKQVQGVVQNEQHSRISIIISNKDNPHSYEIGLYDFLFDPEVGFAKAFWPDTKSEKKMCICSDIGEPEKCVYDFPIYHEGECSQPDNKNCEDYKIIIQEHWEYPLQQMAIADDVLEYLEQFK